MGIRVGEISYEVGLERRTARAGSLSADTNDAGC